MADHHHHHHHHHGHGVFVPESVRIVDYNASATNILVRGSSAFGADGFAFSQLLEAIQADSNFSRLPQAIQSNINTAVTNNSTLQVIDFCLIGYGPGNHKDKKIVASETHAFDSSAAEPAGEPTQSNFYPVYVEASSAPWTGTMVYWPVQSIGTNNPPCAAGDDWPTPPNPPYPDLSILPEVSGNPNGYNFAGLVPAIAAALTSNITGLPANNGGSYPGQAISNAIIYVHCDSGVNRTGAAIISYLLTYGSHLLGSSGPLKTLIAAQTMANSAPAGNDASPYGGADVGVAMAYCNYLNSPQKVASGKLVTAAVPCQCQACPGNTACTAS